MNATDNQRIRDSERFERRTVAIQNLAEAIERLAKQIEIANAKIDGSIDITWPPGASDLVGSRE